MRLSLRRPRMENHLQQNHWEPRTPAKLTLRLTNRCLTNPVSPLVPVIPTVIILFLLFMACAVHTSDHRTASTSDIRPEERPLPPSMGGLPHTNNRRTVPTPGAPPIDPIIRAARRRIDELAEVTQLVTSPSGFGHTFVLAACARRSNPMAGRCYRA